MPPVLGVKRVLTTFQQSKAKVLGGASKQRLVVGYGTSYGIYVHENLQAHHPVGMALFLRIPAMALAPIVPTIIAGEIRRGGSLTSGLWAVGNQLKTRSQALCPVDTGLLRSTCSVEVHFGG